MGIICLLIFLALFFGDKRRDFRKSDISRTFLGGIIGLAVIAFLLSNLSWLLPVGVIGYIIYRIVHRKGGPRDNARTYTYDPRQSEQERQARERQAQERNAQERYSQGRAGSYSGSACRDSVVKSTILPRATRKRRRIISNFNKKYNLYLTDEEIQRITDSSYLSEAWKREVEAMSMKYENKYEWFTGDTAWLRVYLYAFHVQTVSSDFPRQMQIVEEAFDELFCYAQNLTELNTGQRINKINERYMTEFDDASFMIAYRFMEARGHRYKLMKDEVPHADSDMDDIMRKYQQ